MDTKSNNNESDTLLLDKVRLNAPIALLVIVALFIITTTAYFVTFMNKTDSRLAAVESQVSINSNDIEETRNIVFDVKMILVELVTDVKWLRADREKEE